MLRYSSANLPQRYHNPLQQLFAQCSKIARAWNMKESLGKLWMYRSRTWCERFFKGWHWRATHSRMPSFSKLAHMIKKNFAYIQNHCDHQVTNAVSEGLNSRIQAIKHMSFGYRNKENFKTAVLFFCGGLQLHP